MKHSGSDGVSESYCFVLINETTKFFIYDIERDTKFIVDNFDVLHDSFFIEKSAHNLIIPSPKQYAIILMRFTLKPTRNWTLNDRTKQAHGIKVFTARDLHYIKDHR